MSERQVSTHMVSPPDTKAICKIAEDFLRQKFPQEYPATKVFRLQPLCEIGIVEKSGKHYMIDTEGVGCTESIEDNNMEIAFYMHNFDDNGKEISFDMFPCLMSNLKIEEVLTYIKEDDKISLDKFIRTFGSRLDNNFRNWEYFLSE